MDCFGVLGVTASIIACIQLTGALLKRVGPSDHSIAELNHTLQVISGFKGAYEGLKLCLEFNVNDEVRISTLQHLEMPLRDSKTALEFLEAKLKSVGSRSFIGKYVVGKIWDGKFKQHLRRLEESKKLLELAMQTDQHIILGAIKNYIRNVAEDVQGLRTTINKNGKRLLEVDECSRRIHQETTSWGHETREAIGKLNEDVFAHTVQAKQFQTRISENLHNVNIDIQQWKMDAEKKAADETKLRILSWLATTDPTIEHRFARGKHQQDTGNWFLRHETYLDWRYSPGSFLWLHGIAGSGKSMLCSTIIEDMILHCSLETGRAIGFYYVSYSDHEKRKTLNFLRSIIAQLAQQKPEFPQQLKELFMNYQVTRPPPSILKSVLRSILELQGENYIIIDALDEASHQDGERRELCACLKEVSTWGFSNLHILVTSRRIPDVYDALSQITTLSEIPIQGLAVDADIRLYVDDQLFKNPRLNAWSPEVKDDIRKTLTERSQGMFQWVSCQLEVLENCISVTAIRNSLKALPDTLDETYERILLGIAPDYQEIAFAALNWLASSKARLTVEVLSEAMIIRPDANTPFNIEDRLRDLHDVLRVLSSLVVIEDPLTFASFVYEVQGSREKSSDGEEENGSPSESNYSEEDGTTSGSNYSEEDGTTSGGNYSEEDGTTSGGNYSEEDGTTSRSNYSEDSDGGTDYCWDTSSDSDKTVDLDEENRIKFATSIVRLAHFSVLEYLVSTRISRGAASTFSMDINLSNSMILKGCLHYLTYCNMNQSLASTSQRFPLLFYASRWWPSHAKSVVDTVSLSLVCKCLASESWVSAWLQSPGTNRWNSIRSPTCSQSNEDDSLTQALYLAVELKITGAIKLLVELGADPNKRGPYGFQFPIIAAAFQDDCQAIQELIKLGADITVSDRKGGTAFHHSIASGSSDAVRLLLEKGQDVNLQGPYGQRPLYLAIKHERGAMIRLLLENGAIFRIDEIQRLHPSPKYRADFEVLLSKLMKTGSQYHDVIADLLCKIWDRTEEVLSWGYW